MVVVKWAKSYKINPVMVYGWREEVIVLVKVITPPCTSSMCEVTQKSSGKDKTNPRTGFYNSLYSHANRLHLKTELVHVYAKLGY